MKSGIAALWGALLVLVCASAQAGQQTAVDWLQNQIAVDGHFENQAGLATDFQAASAAFRALADQADPAELEAALAFLRTQGYDSTENLSRKIIAGRLQGESVSTLVAELAGRQNPDGGFGELVGYNSTILDTAWALKALDAAHEPDATVTGMAVQYILDHQQSDGGWLGTGGNGSLYVSAMATNAIWHLRHVYNLTDSINAAVQHLLAERNGTDLWSEPFVSAAALIAVAPALVDSTKISDSVSQLAGLQLSDGSWDDDVFTTALALRALQAVQRGDPDLGIIRGRIIDGDYGYPVAGVHIAATGPESLSATTDEQGN
ncbi:MAG TPA: prenyltransferase/squalene oxidase repeat-containing protein, partial [Gammaproteobacteria bacterium]|nr:prenyltransferase/squalene oxidase repeat-containing protein [Gammaproteobacteria bacterium]